MRVITVKNPGERYILAIAESDIPPLSSQDVLIKVAASGVNRADIYQAMGRYRPPPGAPSALGLEVSGEIMKIGMDVKMHAVGDTVCALLQGGGYAEYAAAPEWRALRIPAGLDSIQAASLPEALFTVYLNLFELARLKPGERVLIQGGASGIGVMAIQMAKAFGARVFATAGSSEKCRLCLELGAEKTINYHEEDFVSALGEEMDVILDIVGGGYFQKHLKLAANGGRIISIGFIESAKAEINAAPLLLKNLTWIGSALRSRSEKEIYSLAQSLHTVVWPLIESGKIKPVIDSVFSLEKSGKAHERMQAFKHAGKIILSTPSM